MVDVPKVLTNDIGPLPVWAWGLAGGAGIGLGLWWRRRTATATGPRTAAPTIVPGEVLFSPAAGGVSGSASGGLVSGGTVTEPSQATNNDWRRRALAIAIEQGYTATTADTILSLYFDGEPLTADQQKLLDIVIPSLGLPPDPPSIRSPQAPAPPSTPDPGTDPAVSDPVADQINAGYLAVLGRQADSGGLAYWRTVLGGGGITSDEQFRQQLAGSKEAVQKSVAGAYREVLLREPDPAGLENWTNAIMSGRMTIEGVKSALRNSPEYQQRIAPK